MQHGVIRCSNMTPFSRIKLVGLAAAGTLAALTIAGVPARADQPLINLGPVGPSEPILVTIGTQRVIAFYVPEGGVRRQCRGVEGWRSRRTLFIGTGPHQPEAGSDVPA